jgi:catechol-2,3-dioxygenase
MAFPLYVRDPDGNKIELYAKRTDNPFAATKRANAVQSLKFLKFVATPKSRLRTN